MKKNITINLYGTLYAIDDDAYNLLERYLNSMKNYFSRQEGGEEIADDIEHRVAELLWQQKEAGAEAVSLEHVKEIIKSIGNPAEIDEGTSANTEEHADNFTETSSGFTASGSDYTRDEGRGNGTSADSIFDNIRNRVRNRYLYRNPKDKIIGGVCSGLSEYFDTGDPILWRLLAVVLTIVCMSIDWWVLDFFMSFCIPITYLALCFIVPVAHTPEDTLRMKGKEVNPENLNEEILNSNFSADDRPKENIYSTVPQGGGGSGCLKMILFGLLAIICFPLILMLVIFVFVAIVLISIAGKIPLFMNFGNGIFSVDQLESADKLYQTHSGIMWLGVACAIGVVALLIHIIRNCRKPEDKRMSGGMWMFTIGAILLMGLGAFVAFGMSIDKLSKIQRGMIDVVHTYTINDIPFNETDYRFFNDNGWSLITAKGCVNNRYTYNDRYIAGDYYRRFLDADSYDEGNRKTNNLVYTARTSEYVEPGIYRLYANARAKSEGAYIYVSTSGNPDSTNVKVKMIPPYKDHGGNIYKTVADSMYKTDPVVAERVNHYTDDEKAFIRDSKGRGWSVVYIDSIIVNGDHDDSTLYYGVSTDKSLTGHPSPYRGWFSVSDFELVKIDNVE